MTAADDSAEPLHILARLTVCDEAAFQEFETAAVGIMSRYGGRLLSAFEAQAAEGEASTEIHLLEFPNRDAFDAYRQDGELQAMQALRARGISHSEVILSRRLKHY